MLDSSNQVSIRLLQLEAAPGHVARDHKNTVSLQKPTSLMSAWERFAHKEDSAVVSLVHPFLVTHPVPGSVFGRFPLKLPSLSK